MKKSLILLAILSVGLSYAQPNTSIYLYDIVNHDGKISFENIKTITDRNGYNNQPSFYDDNTLLFVTSRNNQTDIVQLKIAETQYSWLTNTPYASEYSPLRIPNSNDVSAIRLDTSGLQRLYRYHSTSEKATMLIKKLKVGYHVWDTKDQLITSTLVKDGMNLMLNFLPEEKNNTINTGVGRSLHKIPNSAAISFIKKVNDISIVSSYDPTTGNINDLWHLPSKTQDMCWLNGDAILIPSGKSILLGKSDKSIDLLHTFKEKEIYNITRIAVSPNGRYLALVTDVNPEMIADRQVKTFNSGDLNAFVNCFSDNVVVRNYPNKVLYKGRSKMKENYGRHFEKNLNTQVEVVNRIVIDDIIIDEEIIREDGEEFHQAAMYQTERGYIKNMAFIQENSKPDNLKELMQKHLKSYNNGNLNKFLKHYYEGVEVYNLSTDQTTRGIDKFRARYEGLFKRAVNLNAEIKNQIIVGNKVINDEVVTIGASTFRSVAIYEISNNQIERVTFIR